MLMYKTFLTKVEKMEINNKRSNDNGYYTSYNFDQGSKKELNNVKMQNMRSSQLAQTGFNPMQVFFLFHENSIHMKNIDVTCDSLNLTYDLSYSPERILSNVKNHSYDIVVMDRHSSNSSDYDIYKLVLNMKTEVRNKSTKFISFSDRIDESFSELCTQGFDEQWINYGNTCSLRNYLESYLYNQFKNSYKISNISTLENAFDKLMDGIVILNDTFQIEMANVMFQNMFKQKFTDITGLNWFKFHQISNDKIQSILSDLALNQKWSGTLINHNDQLNDIYYNVIIKSLDTTKKQYIVNINIVTDVNSKSETSQLRYSNDRDINIVPFNRNKEAFLTHSSVSIESPILKVMKIINSIQDLASPIVNNQLQKIIEILSSKDLFITTVDALKTDKMSTNLIDGLLSNNATIFAQTETRRHSSSLTKRRPTRDNSEIIHDHINQVLAKINKISEVPENEEINAIEELLEEHRNWSFDILRLEKLTEFKPLRHIGMKIFSRFDVGMTLNIDFTLFQNWLYVIETNYNESNTYHNSTHAADVLQSSAWFLERNKINEIFDSYDDAITIIAAIIHDLGHPGRTNPFLINSNHSLAVLYNDIAVLENHHVSFAFKLTLKDERINIFKNLNSDDYRSLRHGIIDAVLATEMAKHFEHLTKFVNIILKGNDIFDQTVHDISLQKSDFLIQPENKALIRRMLIKCSDVNNPTRPFPLSQEWAIRISEEYFNQTDDEIARNIPVVMPQFNRKTCSIPQSQLTFIDIFLEDMFSAWHSFAETEELINNLHENRIKWKAKADEIVENSEAMS